MRSDGNGRDDLVEPEGVNAGRPVTDRPSEDADVVGDGTAVPGSAHPSADHGQLVSGEEGSRTGRPPQPGQELQMGEG